MSRIGKKPILIPDDVEVKIEGQKVIIKGPKGELTQEIRPEIKVEIKDKEIIVQPFKKNQAGEKKTKAFWGLTRALLFNMVKGVREGYEKKLEIQGLGFRASLEGSDLVLQVGFTHPVRIKQVEGVKFSIEKNIITVSGIDKGLVSQVAAAIRRVKKPEPYKGKGIRYLGEVVRKKVGKKATTTQ